MKIETIPSKINNYNIHRNEVHGYYATVKTNNFWKLMNEYWDDWIGLTYKHPVFLNNMYYQDIEMLRQYVGLHIGFDNERHRS